MTPLPDLVLKAVLGELYDSTKPVRAKPARSVPGFPDLKVLAFVPDVNGPDDEVYAKCHWMRENIPRGFVVVYDVKNKTVVSVARGPRKFGGVTAGDDDDSKHVLLNGQTIRQWAMAGVLEVTSEEKENGKFSLVKMFQYNGQWLCLLGSKTNYRVVASADEALALAAGKQEKDQILIQQIAEDVAANWDSIRALFEAQGDVTLVGELCDGLHFVPMDTDKPVIKFFGIFVEGNALEPEFALKTLESYGILHVDHHQVNVDGIPIDEKWFGIIIAMARAGKGEGKVLYFRNKETGEIFLAKNKTAVYIMKRVLRSLLESPDGFKAAYAKLANLFVERSEYHMLSTSAAVRFYKQLIAFLDWMVLNRVPFEALDFNPVASPVRGDYPYRGFAAVWQRFLDETGAEDMVATPDDIGAFDAKEFHAAVGKIPSRQAGATPPVVLFLQMPQGGGKSTIGDAMAKLLSTMGFVVEIVEQDQWFGMTGSAQTFLSYLVEHCPRVDAVIVTRCNANSGQYKHYLNRALAGGARVVFATPAGIEDPKARDMCIAGVKRRSEKGDLLMIGRIELDAKKAVKIVEDTHKVLTVHPQAYRFKWMKADAGGSLHTPLDIARELVEFVLNVRADASHDAIVMSAPRNTTLPRVSVFCVSPQDDAALCDVAAEHNIQCMSSKHCTQEFIGNLSKKKVADEAKNPTYFLSPAGTPGTLTVTHLVVHNKTGQAAFRVADPSFAIKSGKPHITAFVPPGSNAAYSMSFVFCDDPEVVTVHELSNPLMATAKCVWY